MTKDLYIGKTWQPLSNRAKLPRPALAVERAVLNSLGQMLNLNFVGARQVGDGAGHFQDAVVGAGAEAEALHGGFEQLAAGRAYLANVFHHLRGHHGVGVHLGLLGKALTLNFAGSLHALLDVGAGFGLARFRHLVEGHGRDLHVQVNAVEQRPTYLIEVFLHHVSNTEVDDNRRRKCCDYSL